MLHHIKTFMLSVLCFSSLITAAQQTEFPKEFIAHVRLQSGMVTSPGADLFVGGIQIVPEYTLIEHKLRGGVVVGGFYSYSEINGLFGPTLSLKLTEFKGGHFGSLGNLHVNFDHLWGTDKQRL